MEKLKRIENALIGYMAMDTANPAHKDCRSNDFPQGRRVRRGIPEKEKLAKKLALLPQDLIDPWGKPIEYLPAKKAAQLKGCEAGVYPILQPPDSTEEEIFKLMSSGPDTDDPDDDIIITRRRTELVGTLVAAGIQIDNTNPPTTP